MSASGRPLSAYLDTNAYTHILGLGCVTDAQVAALTDAVSADRLQVVASFDVVEELVAGFLSSPEIAVEKLKILSQLAALETRTLRPTFEFIPELVRSYAEGRSLPSPWLDPKIAERLASSIGRLIRSGKVEGDFRKAVEAGRDSTRRFAEDIREGREHVLAGWAQQQQELRAAGMPDDPPDWGYEYSGPISEGFITGLVKRLGLLAQCETRGLDGLFRVASLRAFGLVNAAYVFRQTFQGRGVRPSDAIDLRHGVNSVNAPVFISCDEDFRKTMNRAGLEGVEVLDLPEFIARYVTR